ncbi:Isoquinoline 1-oxidoreductase alpha subunit [hydrothermal vent metagenome]|uniref:Isoquinoline 1-oxidoreductase alpha subunit n=1 Tax=hydrothermal vent metagenome TaxID=652676 RepID=A0A160TU56_9ZZZZ
MEFVVNNKAVTTSAAERTPLLYVLRNELGLRAAKYGCGTGHCGACTVLVDGRPENSCEFEVSLVEGCRVTTLEGLPNTDLHPVQQAFIEEQAAQCGYCTAGLIMRLVSLLETTPCPVVPEVRSALDRHLCRCGSHSRVLKVIDRLFSEELVGTTTPS